MLLRQLTQHLFFSQHGSRAVRKVKSAMAAESGSRLDHFWREVLPAPFSKEAVAVDTHIREGRFQRSMSLLAGGSSVLAGLEVSYEHYRGSYGQEIMWTPVVLSGAMTVAGIWGFFSKWAARTGGDVAR